MAKDVLKIQLNVSASEVYIEPNRKERSCLRQAEKECSEFLLPADRFVPATTSGHLTSLLHFEHYTQIT